MAAKHNFPITHHIWQRLSQQKASGPSIQSKEIDPLSVFACDCVKKKGRERSSLESWYLRGTGLHAYGWQDVGESFVFYCVVADVSKQVCVWRVMCMERERERERDVLELVGVRKPSAKSSHAKLKLKR